MICPETGAICKYPECKEEGRCLDQIEEEGEECDLDTALTKN